MDGVDSRYRPVVPRTAPTGIAFPFQQTYITQRKSYLFPRVGMDPVPEDTSEQTIREGVLAEVREIDVERLWLLLDGVDFWRAHGRCTTNG
jgi:hypothetical protein